MSLNLFDTGEQPIKIFSGIGRENIDRSVTEKKKIYSNLVKNSVDEISDASCRLNEIELIDDNNARFGGFLNEARNLLVLCGNPFDSKIQTSARSMLCSDRMTLKTSTEESCFARGRMPAVSMRK